MLCSREGRWPFRNPPLGFSLCEGLDEIHMVTLAVFCERLRAAMQCHAWGKNKVCNGKGVEDNERCNERCGFEFCLPWTDRLYIYLFAVGG